MRIVAAAAVAAAVALGMAAPAAAAPTSFGPGCVVDPANRAATLDSLRWGCSEAQYDALYSALPAGPAPAGVTDGFARNLPGAGLLWQGKVFTPGAATNRVAGALAFPAAVYPGPSLLDGRPAVVIDYPPGSPVGFIRDEVRQVLPGVWAGQVVDRSGAPRKVGSFVLTAAP